MSEAATWLVLNHSASRGSTRLVALAVAFCADEHGVAEVPLAALRTMTRLAERTVRYATAELVRLGEVEVTSASRDGSVSRYRLLLSQIAGAARNDSGGAG